MATVPSRELRNNTRQLVDRVAEGEHVTITVSGVPVATLVPSQRRGRWMPRNSFVSMIESCQADAALRSDLDEMLGDESTDDLRFA